jgi:hypothetical protein
LPHEYAGIRLASIFTSQQGSGERWIAAAQVQKGEIVDEEQASGIADTWPGTVAELMERISRERKPLEQAAAGLSDDDLVATSGGWSVKDHLAHVAEWERRLLGEVQGDLVAAHFGTTNGDILEGTVSADVLNAAIHARHRDDSPASVREEFRASGEALRAAFAGLSDADLQQPVRPDDPNVETLVELIGWDTFRHYPDHVAAITDLK